MSNIYIVKGDRHVVDSKKADAEELYGFLLSYVRERGHAPFVFSPESELYLDEARYILAHSRGTNTVMDALSEGIPLILDGIAFFDPSQQYCDAWNALMTPRVAFISRVCNKPYAEYFHRSEHLTDGHFFTNSFSRIKKRLDRIISPAYSPDDDSDQLQDRFHFWPRRGRYH